MARDAGDGLARALCRAAAAHGVALAIETARSTRWASATFAGSRHRLRATADDTPALATWLGSVAEHAFAIPGTLVADLAIDAVERAEGRAAIVFAALTLEDQ